ncbi:MAG: DUF3810 domain-containing protein [Oscillospiraceae bacterium]|nr:DUF3810 domain-containing protein [Oscillospiraceae bacterium]
MKYWRGYLTAAILAAITWALGEFCRTHSVLVDMIYPYFTRLIQTTLADWSSSVSFCLWQVLAILLVIIAIASIVLMIIFKWNFFQWLGWVLAGGTLLFTLHTGMYGLNNYAGPLADDIRLSVADETYTVTELSNATEYFRDMANQLALQIPRTEDGKPDYPTFQEMAESAGEGYKTLTYDYSFSVFAGSTVPVKELGWADLYTSMGIAGVTMPLTGEAAVNPNIPVVSLPFTMCHEMAHRMCISLERDANLAAFLACRVHNDPVFQYSGYFMAFRYCYNALISVKTSAADNAASNIYSGINESLLADLQDYKAFYAANMDDNASNLANSVNDTYIKVSGDESGTASYSEVCDLLVSWHLQEIYLPEHQDEVQQFDPLDKNQVDLGN